MGARSRGAALAWHFSRALGAGRWIATCLALHYLVTGRTGRYPGKLQGVIDDAGKRARDMAAMPAACPTATGCRDHGCHGECLPPNVRGEATAARTER